MLAPLSVFAIAFFMLAPSSGFSIVLHHLRLDVTSLTRMSGGLFPHSTTSNVKYNLEISVQNFQPELFAAKLLPSLAAQFLPLILNISTFAIQSFLINCNQCLPVYIVTRLIAGRILFSGLYIKHHQQISTLLIFFYWRNCCHLSCIHLPLYHSLSSLTLSYP